MSYCHFSEQERYVIYHLKLYGLSLREIGRRLGRHHTSISIHERPPIVEERPRFGDWEGDTVVGKQSSGGITMPFGTQYLIHIPVNTEFSAAIISSC